MTSSPALVWFRLDLRRNDNPALYHAYESGRPIIPLYILDKDEQMSDWPMGAASKLWLHHSLQSLNDSLNSNLVLRTGSAADIIPAIAAEYDVQDIYWNRCYEPWRIKRDKDLKATLKDDGRAVHSYNAGLMFEPWDTRKDDGTPYRVFTPFYKKACVERYGAPAEPLPAPTRLSYVSDIDRPAIDTLDLLPDIPWHKQIEPHWTPGEDGAQKRLDDFLENGLKQYKTGRNHPDRTNVSRLSPHLHFGEISPRDVWHRAATVKVAKGLETDTDCFHSELGWREFSYHLLYHFPTLPSENFQTKFDQFPWRDSPDDLARWQKGQTGYPIVDAGMRELWQTGYMHNRVRMIVGSFLVKHLMLHWKHGEDWFWDTLLDADLANNSASWQWIAGSGADAAPYFRIFNPITQGTKFDPDGHYTRRYVPELKDLPNKYLFEPWAAPDHILAEAGVALGTDYPEPIIDHKAARQRALDGFSSL